jgi:hypothetical protein
MRTKLCIGSTLLLAGFGFGRASAQVCSGEFSFAGSPAHAFVGMGFNSSAQTYHAGVRVGSTRVFGAAEAGIATYQVGGDAWDYGLGFGVQLGQPGERKAQLCPQIFVGLSRGPQDVGGTGINYSENHFAIGADAGFVAAHKKGFELVPTASFVIANAWYRLTAPATRDSSGFDTWEVLSLGLGFGFNDQVILAPAIAFPMSLSGAGTAYGISFSIKLGSPR